MATQRRVAAAAYLGACVWVVVACGNDKPGTSPEACVDECVPAARQCLGTNAWVMCDNLDADTCFEWPSEPTICPPRKVCSQGTCVDACQDDCSQVGARRCVSGVNAFQVCGDANSDQCLEWGAPKGCNGTDQCSNGRCAGCVDACVLSSRRCVDGTSDQYEDCMRDSGSGCTIYGAAHVCSNGTACQGGQCVAAGVCLVECGRVGDRTCDGNGFRECGAHDADTCLEWGDLNPCPGGTFCSRGECTTTCQNECAPDGHTECYGNGYRVCGNFDADPCLEWNQVNCGAGKSCVNNACVDSSACTSTCTTTGAKKCISDGSGYQVCGDYNGDGCKE
jgi:hypothetical protein